MTKPIESSECTICFEEMYVGSNNNAKVVKTDAKVVETVCKHFFHEACLNNWLKQKNNCPMCRQENPKKQELPPQNICQPDFDIRVNLLAFNPARMEPLFNAFGEVVANINALPAPNFDHLREVLGQARDIQNVVPLVFGQLLPRNEEIYREGGFIPVPFLVQNRDYRRRVFDQLGLNINQDVQNPAPNELPPQNNRQPDFDFRVDLPDFDFNPGHLFNNINQDVQNLAPQLHPYLPPHMFEVD